MSKGGRVSFVASFLAAALFFLGLQVVAEQPPSQSQNQTANKTAASWPDGFFEDSSSITLKGSTLQPQKPVLLERTEFAVGDGKCVREHVQLRWRPDDMIDLYIAIPKGVQKSPVILYLYSFPESIVRFKDDHWYSGTVIDGYAAVGFVSARTAERAEHQVPDEWFVGVLGESLSSSVHDVQMILNYLSDRGDLDMDRIGMFGTGSGGTIAILASAADTRIKAVDVLNPWGDWPDWVAKSWVIPPEQRPKSENKYLDPQFLQVVAPLDPVRWLPKSNAHRVRIQNVRQESTVPVDTQLKLEGAAPNLAEINQFGDYRALLSVEPGAGIFQWLRDALQPDAKSKTFSANSQRIHFFPAEGKPFESSEKP